MVKKQIRWAAARADFLSARVAQLLPAPGLRRSFLQRPVLLPLVASAAPADGVADAPAT